ncbi:hypothetical protein DAPPUDRAFT_100109 [Daphnia pulex]|uniref:H(+)-transporting two-sector ATPase n=1 Tax=Daphnia pulex TaxID=6669 RepID=E9G9D3_DAPPU|nr:hypothetical protein DAPPUDRAFT_100109 [Daphnia pulex]|eukprot:EFX83544.1 hypothetical protein DAPPUDRAFT_100109 [Daphnia pulex]
MQAPISDSDIYASNSHLIWSLQSSIARLSEVVWFGRVKSTFVNRTFSGGSTVRIHKEDADPILGEVVGFRNDTSLIMPYGMLEGVRPGARVDVIGDGLKIYPTMAWKGRVIGALGEPLDDLGPLPQGDQAYDLKSSPSPARTRLRTKKRIDLGVRALNTFTTCCRGQRIGIFSGSGVGKSVLLGQITRFTDCDVVVVGLIGERGREVNDFIEEQLGPEGLKRAVVVVATSDAPALQLKERSDFLLESLPRQEGNPPTVFSELPRLLERAGTTHHEGSITGIFNVLVEGDDHNEPIADATRSILDGHIVLERSIAERGRYPAVNILKSLSRTMPDCNDLEESAVVSRARKLMAIYDDMSEMIQLGTYRHGSSPEVDEAIRLFPKLSTFLSQGKEEKSTLLESFEQLSQVVSS